MVDSGRYQNDERYQRTRSQIGRYELCAEIGRGGMGVVYRAREAMLNRTIALKILSPDLAYQPHFITRLQHEAISAARLRHANIALLYEFGQDDGTPFLAMEYIPGSSLRQLLEAGPLRPERVLDILSQIAQALDYAHAMGIVHRDVKPSNILVGPDDHAVLIDFGLATMAEDTLLTPDSAALGTPHYMSPEQAAGLKADARSDQYALATVAYEMLVGVPPFAGRSATAAIHAHLYESPPLPTERCPTLPVSINNVLLRALAKVPDDRYLAMADFIDALRSALTVSPLPLPRPHPARWQRLLGILSGVVLLLAVVLALLQSYSLDGRVRQGYAGATQHGSTPLPQQIVWSYDSPLIGGPALVVVDGTLVVGTLDGGLVALQASNGDLRWRKAGSDGPFGAPSVGASLIFVGDQAGEVLGLSPSSGEPIWRRRVEGAVRLAPVLDTNRLIVITDKGYIYLLEAGSGQVIWSRPLGQGIRSPAVAAGRIFVSAGRSLFVLDIGNGMVVWQFTATSTITTRPAIFDGMALVGTESGVLHALDAADGHEQYRYQAHGALSAAPAVGDGLLFVADQAGNLTALSRSSASPLWHFAAETAIGATPLLVDGRLFFGTSSGMVYGLDARSGRQLAHMQLGGTIDSPLIVDNGLIFTRADRIYALGS